MDQSIITLFDRYTHGGMDRRQFLERLAVMAGSATAASALLPVLENNYAHADTIAADDARLASETVSFAAAGASISGYLVRPVGSDKLPAVIVIHENRGLNPHIRDVARRAALAGFVTLAVDYLSLVGGTPDDQDKARDLFGTLKPDDVVAVGRGAVAYLKGRADTNGKVGAVGFCWGGGAVGNLAVAEPGLGAGVVYYGSQPKAEGVAAITAPLLLNYAGLDERINAGIPAFEAALKAAGKSYELHIYANVNHAFNNDTNAARYDKAAADLAWERTITFFKKSLS